MATLTWNGSWGFKLSDLDLSSLFYADDYIRTSTRFTASYDDIGYRDEFRGYGFTYDVYGVPTGGVVTGYASIVSGRKVASLDGGSVPVTSLVNAASTFSTSDDRDIFRSVLSGSDRITGGSYNDRLEGFAGRDVLYGRQGADRLYGGLDADTFTFKSIRDSTVSSGGRDTIQDFSFSQGDRIDLRAIDANATAAGNQAFRFIGKAAFQERAGELRSEKYGSGSLVSGDVDGDGSADFSVYLKGVVNVSKSYFML